MSKTYEVQCRTMAKASFEVEAENPKEAERKFDDWLAQHDVNDLDWETDWIDDVEVIDLS